MDKIKNVILCNRLTVPSCKILRRELEKISGIRYPIVRDINSPVNIFLRYGNSHTSDFIQEDSDINPKNLIHICSNKYKFSELMLKNGLFAPKFSQNFSEITFPCVIRSTLTGYGGEGIIMVKNKEDLIDKYRVGYWWTPFIFMVSEFRVHIANGNIIKLFKKVPKEDYVEEMPIRNLSSCHYSLQNTDGKFGKLKELVTKMTEIFGEKYFMALDVGWVLDKKDYFILEGNSAPGLNEFTANTYAQNILEMIKKE